MAARTAALLNTPIKKVLFVDQSVAENPILFTSPWWRRRAWKRGKEWKKKEVSFSFQNDFDTFL